MKMLLLGDAGVGKTSVCRRYTQGLFATDYNETIGVEFVPYDLIVDNEKVRLQIWDTAGQEQYRSLGKSYYRNVYGVLLVFSFDSRSSFLDLEQWINDVKSQCHPSVEILLLGNKIDLVDGICISRSEVEAFAESHELEFIETSAKTNTGITESFYSLGRKVLRAIASGEIRINRGQTQAKEPETKNERRQCC